MRIEIDDLQKTYGRGCRALDRVRLTLESPGMIGLVGPNGAGKTTLMQLLVGQMLPSGGSIRVDDADLQRHGKAFRRRLGYLPQDFGLYEELTVRQFLDYMACLKGLPSPRGEAIRACIERTSLAEKADARIRTLSGGQKQRVGIAQALLNDPELLIVDEPTVGLDPEERIRFRNLFSRDAGRRLVILSTHIIEDVESICNRLIVLHQGRDPVRRNAERAGPPGPRPRGRARSPGRWGQGHRRPLPDHRPRGYVRGGLLPDRGERPPVGLPAGRADPRRRLHLLHGQWSCLMNTIRMLANESRLLLRSTFARLIVVLTAAFALLGMQAVEHANDMQFHGMGRTSLTMSLGAAQYAALAGAALFAMLTLLVLSRDRRQRSRAIIEAAGGHGRRDGRTHRRPARSGPADGSGKSGGHAPGAPHDNHRRPGTRCPICSAWA